MPRLSRTAVLSLVVVWATACGGQSQLTGDEESGGEGGTSASGGTGGTSKGGTTSKGGSGAVGGSTGGTGAVGGSTGGTGAVGGSTGGTGAVDPVGGSAGTGASGGFGGMICCTAAPVCGPNEQEISGPATCPPGSMCHAVSVCCSTIWCATVPQCDAYPTCDEGDTTLEGPCPPNVACYTRSLCGSTVSCIDECNPETEYNRNYVSEDPQCRGQVGLVCPSGLAHFENDCGCGCEQDATCPEAFYCHSSATDTADAAPAEPPPGMPAPIPQPCDPAELMRCPLSEIIPIRR